MWRLNSFTVWWDDRGVANKPAPALPLRDGDQAILEKVVRSSATTAGAAQRARIVLLASQGVANALISELVGVSRPTVNLWRGRYLEHGLEGLVDIPRPGRPKVVDDAAIITATPRPSPKRLGVTHWSSRLLAPRLGVYQVHGHQGLEEVQGSGHGRPTRSSSPPTRNWRPRSPTL